MMTTIAMTLPAQVPPNIALTASENGAVELCSCVVDRMPNTAMSESMYTTAVASVPKIVARGMLRSGSLHLAGRDGGDLDAEVAEQRDRHPAADRGDRALAADVPRRVVGALDEEEADGRHERERGELEDRRPRPAPIPCS